MKKKLIDVLIAAAAAAAITFLTKLTEGVSGIDFGAFSTITDSLAMAGAYLALAARS